MNVLMSEVELYSPRVLASVREVEARRVPQHMRMHRKLDARCQAGARDHVMHVDPRHRSAALRGENVSIAALLMLPRK
jgi:hypothetical protein